MSLTHGTRLGPYEITAAIGAGGMGEVYRATDGNLKRSVVIKVLPASVAGDANRLAQPSQHRRRRPALFDDPAHFRFVGHTRDRVVNWPQLLKK